MEAEKEEHTKFKSRSSVFPCRTFRSPTNANFLNLGCVQFMNLEKEFLGSCNVLQLAGSDLFLVKMHSRMLSKPNFVEYGLWKQRQKF